MTYRRVQANRISGRSGQPVVAYQQPFTPPAILAAAQKKHGDVLWQSCYDYNFQFFSGGVYAQMLELKLAGSQKAAANQQWVLWLWSLYYQRKAAMMAATTEAEVCSVPTDFSEAGRPPFTVEALMADVPR
jgi:hypothetical protein